MVQGAMALRRDQAALRNRRIDAAKLFRKGWSQAEVARRFGVSRVAAMNWHRQWSAEGVKGLESSGPLGRPPKLTEREWAQAEKRLLQGPNACGYDTDLWTLARVAEVIEDITGVSFHPGHVWRLLRGRGWSLQRPTTRARERDEDQILRWKKQGWRRLKKTPGAAERSSSSTKRGSAKGR